MCIYMYMQNMYVCYVLYICLHVYTRWVVLMLSLLSMCIVCISARYHDICVIACSSMILLLYAKT
jgi:hypothetical protein